MVEKWLIRSDEVAEAGYLYYDTDTKKWRVEITNTKDVIPGSIIFYARKGHLILSHEESLGFVQDRVIPPNRQNIQEILEYHNFPYYDEYFFIKKGNGRCVMDDFYLVPV